MKKTKDGRRRFTREFKIAAIKRVQQGEKQIAVARELKIGVELLGRWRYRVRMGGEDALVDIGGRTAIKKQAVSGKDATRIAELERLIGKQQAEMDFLEQALRRVEELRRPKRSDGGTASSE